MTFNFEELKVYEDSIKWINKACDLKINPNIVFKRAVADHLSRPPPERPTHLGNDVRNLLRRHRRKFFWIARGLTWELAKKRGIKKTGLGPVLS